MKKQILLLTFILLFFICLSTSSAINLSSDATSQSLTEYDMIEDNVNDDISYDNKIAESDTIIESDNNQIHAKDVKNKKTSSVKTFEVSDTSLFTDTFNQIILLEGYDECVVNIRNNVRITDEVGANYHLDYTSLKKLTINGFSYSVSTDLTGGYLQTMNIYVAEGQTLIINDVQGNGIGIENYGNTTLNNFIFSNSREGVITNHETGIIHINNSNLRQVISSNEIIIENTVFNAGGASLTVTDGYCSLLNVDLYKSQISIWENASVYIDEIFNMGSGNAIIKGYVNNITPFIPALYEIGGNRTFENLTFEGGITVPLLISGNITFKNCILDKRFELKNNSKMIIDDDCILGDNIDFYWDNRNIVEIEINDISRILDYLSELTGTGDYHNLNISNTKSVHGNITFENSKINAKIFNYGLLTLINCDVNGEITNYGGARLYLINSTMKNQIYNRGNLTIDNQTTFSDDFYLVMDSDSIIYADNMTRLLPYMNYYNDDYTIENLIINREKTNNKSLTLDNCTLNNTINNYGNLIINDNCNITSNAFITGNGTITINDTDKILPYIESINNNWTIIGYNFDNPISNTANIILDGCRISTTINNNGNITINDNCIIDSNAYITGSGNIIVDDILSIMEVCDKLNGTYTISNYTFTKKFTLDGNIILDKCIITPTLVNYGNLTFNNCRIDNENETENRIINNGNLTISTNTRFFNATITGEGYIIINNTKKILPYISLLKGNHSINKYTFNKPLTITDTIEITNSTIDTTITNNGTLIIDDNTNFTQNAHIQSTGRIIINDTNRIINYLEVYDGNISLTNVTIYNNKINNANLTLINCSIQAQITNNANLSLINCSLSNNNMTVTESKIDGFLLNNLAKTTMIDCIIENNTFNSTSSRVNNILYGAIVNRGILNIYNATFKNNRIGQALSTNTIGDACCIYHEEGTLKINNSIFTDNYAAKDAPAVYATANMMIYNTNFTNNTASRSGGALAIIDSNTTIDTCQFIENKVIALMNNFAKNGGAIIIGDDYTQKIHHPNCMINNTLFKSNTIKTSYTNNGVTLNFNSQKMGNAIYRHYGEVLINNSQFINHEANAGLIYSTNEYYSKNIQEDEITFTNIYNSIFNNCSGIIIQDYNSGYSNVINNTFEKNNAICINKEYGYIHEYTHPTTNITDNIFIDNRVKNDTIITTQYQSNGLHRPNPFVTIENNQYLNTSINDNVQLDIPEDITENVPITITGTYTINNTDYYDNDILQKNRFNIYINNEFIQSINELTFTITPAKNMQITIQPTISQSTFKRKILQDNTDTPTSEIIKITPENYDEIIYDDEIIGLSEDTLIIFEGRFNDKQLYFTTNNIIINGENATFTDSNIILEASNIILENMSIYNHETTYPIENFADNNIIRNNHITLNNTNGPTAGIYSHASNTSISNNTIFVDGPAMTIDFSSTSGISNTQAILLEGGNNNRVEYNNLTVTTTQESELYGTIEAITNSIDVTNTLIQYNIINVSGAKFSYGIDSLNNLNNVTIQYNSIHVESYRYTDGIQVGNGAQNSIITRNNITCICHNSTPVDEEAITYGIITSNMGSGRSNNITISYNNININGSVNYAIEVYQTTNTFINNNNITVNGLQSMGIGYAHSENSIVTQNNIRTNGDATVPLTSVTEEIKQANTGIQIQQDSDNILIENNIIQTNDVAKQDKTINVNSKNITIINNQLQSSTKSGDFTVSTTQQDTFINNNTDVEEIIVKTETKITLNNTIGLIKQPTTITVYIKDADDNNITGGKVLITDSNGNILGESNVTDGLASIIITSDIELQTTITATYIPELDTIQSSNTTAILEIQEALTTITIVNTTFTAGECITLKAYLQDQLGNKLTGGKVVFKINGKTLKDSEGKIIYAKVVNGIATINYNLPITYADKNISIQAVYSGSSKYSSARTEINTSITKPTPTFTTEDIITNIGGSITLKATITDSDKVINSGKVVFKINGKTLKDSNGRIIYAQIEDNHVNLEYTLPTSYKAKEYTLTATLISNDYERLVDTKTLTII